MEVLANVRGKILNPGIHLRSLDNPWEGEGWDLRGLIKLDYGGEWTGEGGGCSYIH